MPFISEAGGGWEVLGVPLVRGPLVVTPLVVGAVPLTRGGVGLRRSGSSGAVKAVVAEGISTGGVGFTGLTPAKRSKVPVGAGRAARVCFSASYFSPVFRSPMRICRQSCSWEMAWRRLCSYSKDLASSS